MVPITGLQNSESTGTEQNVTQLSAKCILTRGRCAGDDVLVDLCTNLPATTMQSWQPSGMLLPPAI